MYTTKTVSSQTTSPWIPLDDNQAAFNVSVAVAVTGTLTYTVQFTLDNIQDPTVTPVAFDVSALTGKTVAASTSLRSSVKAVRLNVTAYTSGSATIGVRQGTSWDGVDFATTSGPITLFQSGVPFWIPPGDGGATGFSFDGTRGLFTLSAESPMSGSLVSLAAGGLFYIPAGAGGLTAGWYWGKTLTATTGEIFAETYTPGSGVPVIPTTFTALPNCTAGRITQSVAEITATQFTMRGGSMGPNGDAVIKLRYLSSSSANTKRVLVRAAGSTWLQFGMTNTYNTLGIQATLQNMGVENSQISPRKYTTQIVDAYDCGSSSSSYFGQVQNVDTSVDALIAFSAQLTVNTDSIILFPLSFRINYGA